MLLQQVLQYRILFKFESKCNPTKHDTQLASPITEMWTVTFPISHSLCPAPPLPYLSIKSSQASEYMHNKNDIYTILNIQLILCKCILW